MTESPQGQQALGEREQLLQNERRARLELDRIAADLFDSERRVHIALTAGKMGAWRWDAATNVVDWTDSLEAIYGLAPGAFGRTFEAFIALVHPDDREHVLQCVAEAGKHGSEYKIEFRTIRPDGEEHWISDRAEILWDSSGKMTGITGVCWDSTEEKKHEIERISLLQELRELVDRERQARSDAEVALEELRKANAEIEQFAYLASHDLQEPLRTTTTHAQLLARCYRGRLDEGADTLLDEIVAGTSRMQALISDLLDYSQLTREESRIAGSVDLNRVIDETRQMLAGSIEASCAEIDCGALPSVRGIDRQMLQLFQNLISNAIKYGRPGVSPRVTIRCEIAAGCFQFSVSDNGQGFGQQYAEQIFGIFKRLHGSNIPGTGIGLALCKRIVEAHGGRIWAKSTPGAGSIFYFTLPA